MNRYDLTDFEWSVIEPLLPNKPRGVPRVDDPARANGIMWVLRSGADLMAPNMESAGAMAEDLNSILGFDYSSWTAFAERVFRPSASPPASSSLPSR